MGDANGQPLRVGGAVKLYVRLGDAMYSTAFVIVEHLAVDVILGTTFMNRNVKSIECMRQRIRFRDDRTLPILSSDNVTTPEKDVDARVKEEGAKPEPFGPPNNFHTSNTVRLAKGVTIPAMAQLPVRVTTKAAGLVFLDPKMALLHRHRVRTANGLVEARPDVPFPVVLANFGKRPVHLPKGTVVAIAQRNPATTVHALGRAGVEMLHVLNLPFRPRGKQEESSTPTDDKPKSGFDTNEADSGVNVREQVDLTHLSDAALREKIYEMLEKHSDMWKPGRLGEIRATEHRIDLREGTKPIRQMPYRQGLAMRDLAAKEISKMLEHGVIEPATSEWASPIVFVPKKDGTKRFCVDYRRLNAVTSPDAYPLPRIDDCIDSLGDAVIFTTLDANAGYWQIPVAPEDRDKTTFTCHKGTFRYLRMPFGLRNAPATFQRALDIILSGVRWQTCLIYLDDVIVFSRSTEQHVRDVDHVLSLLRAAGVTLKLKKCFWFQNRVDYLGHVITPGKLSVATENAKAFKTALFPTTLTQLRSFLGAANVYRRFIKDYSKIAKPLNAMLKKDATPNWEDPSESQRAAFEELKRRLTSPPVLVLPKRDRPFMIDTDASSYQLGAVLLQQQNESDPNDWSPVGYWSKTLNDAERNYSATERECFAVVWAVTTLRPYIEGTRFTIRTDHDALRWLMTLTDSSGRLTRWRLRLLEFDFEIVYRPGRVHQVPDALSRLLAIRNDTEPLDDDIPSALDHVMVMTRSRAQRSGNRVTGARHSDRQPITAENEFTAMEESDAETSGPPDGPLGTDMDDDELDDVGDEDPTIFDLVNAYQDDGKPVQYAEVPMPVSRSELLEAQRTDDFCQTVMTRQHMLRDSRFFEDRYGVLRRVDPYDEAGSQIVVPQTLRARILSLAHYPKLAGHPGQTRMYYTLRRGYYWPHMAADVFDTVRNCHQCAKNRIRLRKRTNPLALFPATVPLRSVAIDILGPLTKTKKKMRFLLVMTDRFTKLTQVVPLRTITALSVATAFVEHWVFKYGPPQTLVSDNGSQFASKFFQSVCAYLGIANAFTSTYHPQTNGQVERYNRTVLAMLRSYVNEHQSDWDEYATALTYAYNNAIHRSTGTTPFNLVLSNPPASFLMHRSLTDADVITDKTKDRADFVARLEEAVASARERLRKTQMRYKKDFDKRIRIANRHIQPGQYVYLDPRDGSKADGKLGAVAEGPYRVLLNDKRTFVIQRGEVVERVNSDRVTYSPPPPNVPPPKPFEATTADILEKNIDGQTFVVDELLEHSVDEDGTLQFLVKWAGYDEPTWQPRSDIPEELVSRYFAKIRVTSS